MTAMLLYESLNSMPANTRLAPVRCGMRGHPVTTDMPTIDYFISGAVAKSEDADPRYSERLVRLAGVQAYRRVVDDLVRFSSEVAG